MTVPLRGNDSVEAEAIPAEGLDPDDAAVVTTIDLVRWELELLVIGELADDPGE